MRLASSLLRRRIMIAVTGGSVVSIAFACGGRTDEELTTSSSSGSSSGSSTSSSSSSSGTPASSSGGTSSSSSTSSTSSSGTSPTTPAATCSAGRKAERTCQNKGVTRNDIGYGGGDAVIDAGPPRLHPNGCMAKDQVMDGCCNPAVSDPVIENGVCCWDFCAGGCCGRPIRSTEDDAPIVANAIVDQEWPLATAASSLELDARTRAALVADYTRDALFEHASIASFAVFTLELLSVGAPPDLIALAQQATADEIEHARLTFGIASAFAGGGKSIGADKLPLGNVSPKSSLVEVAAATVRDGCIGETIASLIAAAQAEDATDPAIKAALTKIAEDEARHAELAWRFVRWAVDTGGDDVRTAVAAAFAAYENKPNTAIPIDVDPNMWRQAGRLTRGEYDLVTGDALTNVIGPAARALTGAAPTAQRTASARIWGRIGTNGVST